MAFSQRNRNILEYAACNLQIYLKASSYLVESDPKSTIPFVYIDFSMAKNFELIKGVLLLDPNPHIGVGIFSTIKFNGLFIHEVRTYFEKGAPSLGLDL